VVPFAHAEPGGLAGEIWQEQYQNGLGLCSMPIKGCHLPLRSYYDDSGILVQTPIDCQVGNGESGERRKQWL